MFRINGIEEAKKVEGNIMYELERCTNCNVPDQFQFLIYYYYIFFKSDLPILILFPSKKYN